MIEATLYGGFYYMITYYTNKYFKKVEIYFGSLVFSCIFTSTK